MLKKTFTESISAEKQPVHMIEMTLSSLLRQDRPEIKELLAIMSNLRNQSYPVLITVFAEFYHLSNLIRRYSHANLAFLLGITRLAQILDERRYTSLKGGLLDASARLFQDQVKLLVYPQSVDIVRAELQRSQFALEQVSLPPVGPLSVHTLVFQGARRHLFRYLLEAGVILG